MFRMVLCYCVALLTAPQAFGQLMVTATGTTFTINFDGVEPDVNPGAFLGLGFNPTPSPGQLDSDAFAVTGIASGDIPFGGTAVTPGTAAAQGSSSGGATAGGIYGFAVNNGIGTLNQALGLQPTTSPANFAPGTITLKIRNSTGEGIGSFDIGYNIYARNDQPASTPSTSPTPPLRTP